MSFKIVKYAPRRNDVFYSIYSSLDLYVIEDSRLLGLSKHYVQLSNGSKSPVEPIDFIAVVTADKAQMRLVSVRQHATRMRYEDASRLLEDINNRPNKYNITR